MHIYIDYSEAQKDILVSLEKEGLFDGTKTRLLILMATNNYVRTVNDLAGILCEYPGMPGPALLCEVINECIRDRMLRKVSVLGIEYCQQDNECFEKFMSTIPESIQIKIRSCRSWYQGSECVRILGLLSGGSMGGYINASFIERMMEARNEILLPILNTTPNETVIKTLINRANDGVKVKLLVPDYKEVVCKIRSGKEDMTNEWILLLHDIPNVEIRRYKFVEDALLYSSVVIDRSLCRICVFDYRREKSSNGTLIEVSKQGYDINLITLIMERFNDIWLRSVPVSENYIIHFLKNRMVWTAFAMMICLYMYYHLKEPTNAVLLNCFMALAGFFVNSVYKSIKPLIARLRRRFLLDKN